MMDRKKIVGITRAAEVLGVHPNTLRKWADDGIVPVILLPSGHRRFDVDALKEVREEMTREGMMGKLVA